MNYFKISKFFLYLAPFAVAIVSLSTLFPFIVGKYVWFRTVIDLSLIFFLLGLLLRGDARQHETRLIKWFKSPLAIAVGVFATVFVLAGFFGIDPKFSFWSNFERGEGGLQMLHLYLFFILLGVLLKDEKDWRKFFLLSVIAGLFMIFYGLGAGLKYVDAEVGQQAGVGAQPVWSGKGGVLFQIFKGFIGPSFKENNFRFQGSIGNPAYVATYLIFMLFYSIYLILISKKRLLTFGNLMLGAVILIFGAFFVFTGTRGAFVGLLAALFLGIIYLICIARKWRPKLLILVGIVVLTVIAFSVFKNTPFIKSIPALRIFNISFSARTFQDRIYIWGAAFKSFKERPILGWGPENFSYVFDSHYPTEFFTPERGFGAWFDRAHSVFFDHLVETGILGFLSYLSMFLIFYLQLFTSKFKKENKNGAASNKEKTPIQYLGREHFSKMIIFVVPIAYLVQGLVLFEVLVIYLNLFLFFAFANYRFNREHLQTN